MEGKIKYQRDVDIKYRRKKQQIYFKFKHDKKGSYCLNCK